MYYFILKYGEGSTYKLCFLDEYIIFITIAISLY